MKKVIEIPKELHDKIKALAEKNDRSVNNQIKILLQKAIK